jgi:predicted SAM-dependent methyltransferase
VAEGAANAIGAALRRVPGARLPLEARLALQARAVRRRAARREAELTARDQRWVASLAGRRDLRLNVGSSEVYIDNWINIDISRDPEGRCLCMDATQPWPFADGAADAVNSEHLVEHLTLEAARGFATEAFRVLREGGVLRTSTPDLAGLCREYMRADTRVLEAHRSHGYTAETHADVLNNYFYLWDHRRLYDFESLERLLSEVGFVQVEQTAFGRSRHSLLDGIDRHDPGDLGAFVLCVDAVRPPAAS